MSQASYAYFRWPGSAEQCPPETDRRTSMCDATTTYVQVNTEAWSEGYASLLAEMKAEMPFVSGINEYGGRVSVYLPQGMQESAYKADAESFL